MIVMDSPIEKPKMRSLKMLSRLY